MRSLGRVAWQKYYSRRQTGACRANAGKIVGCNGSAFQVQLYTEGPFDKVVTFLAVEDYGNDGRDSAWIREHSGCIFSWVGIR